MRISRRLTLTGALATLARPARAAPLCLVTVVLNGQPARLILDTGAERTILTARAVTRLRLPLDLWVDTILRGAGGVLERHRNADIAHATLGSTQLYQTTPNTPLSLAVTELSLGAADGLLGGDILRHFTLHLAAGQATLSQRRPPAGLPLTLLWPNRLLAPVTLDSQHLTALIDTGATTSLLNARGLYRMGLTTSAPGPATTTRSIGGPLTVHTHQFQNLQLGPLRIQAPALLTAPVPELAFDMILGLDILSTQPLTLSYPALSLAFA